MVEYSRRRISLHCVICSNECEKRLIRCEDCGRLTHIDCVGFCEDALDVRPIRFVCRECAFSREQEYDWLKSLLRLVINYYCAIAAHSLVSKISRAQICLALKTTLCALWTIWCGRYRLWPISSFPQAVYAIPKPSTRWRFM